jgi:F-type H+-transporting ATPase subunit alpha
MARLEQGKRIVEVLKQDRNSPIAVELQVAIIYAVVNNLLTDIEVEDVKRFEGDLFEYLLATKDDLLSDIRETGALSDDNAIALKAAIETCKAKFLGKDE